MSLKLSEQQRKEILKEANALSAVGGRASSLPVALATLFHPELSPEELEQIIVGEPGLTLRVMKVANSPLFGRSGDVGTVRRAIELLGINTTRGIATAAFLDRSLFRANPGALIDAGSLKLHSLAAAAAAHLLAGPSRPMLAAEAFQAAMLHDVGLLIQQTLDGEALAHLVTTVEAAAADQDAGAGLAARMLERSCCEYPHEVCAAVVFESWHLPSLLVEAVTWHHEPMQAPAPARELAALVHLADCLATRAGYGVRTEPVAGDPDDALLALAGMTPQDLPRVEVLLGEAVDAIAAALQ